MVTDPLIVEIIWSTTNKENYYIFNHQ